MLRKSAFTLVELIFVIIIIGILAMIALPKFSGISEQSLIAKGRSDVMALRTAISSERQKRFMLGDSSYINQLDAGVANNTADLKIFDNNGTAGNVLLSYGVITKNSDGGWMKTGTNQYTYTVSGSANIFDYDNITGQFNCTSGAYCTKLTQ